jgi:hypothetical protein
LEKLYSYGVRGDELEWFKDYLFNRNQSVDIDGCVSDKQPVSCGVPQGSILGPLLFLVFFNDFSECLKHCEVIKFADDTVIYVADKCSQVIEQKLNEDINRISEYFDKNDLIINLKPGKTESILFGTAKNLSNKPKSLNINFKYSIINPTPLYTYLGVVLDTHLNLSGNFDRAYRKASSRIRLLYRLKSNMTAKASATVFQAVVVPLLTYCGIVNLELNKSQMKKITSLERRACFLVNSPEIVLPSIQGMIKKRACILVRRCIEGNLCTNYSEYFITYKNSKNTRDSGITVILPKVRLQVARKGFYFMGAKVYNELPRSIREIKSFSEFVSNIKLHF